MRARNAVIAAIAAVVLSYGVARVLLVVTALRLEGSAAWIAAQIAATSPARSRGLVRAREVLVARILMRLPPPNMGGNLLARDALVVDGPPVDLESVARYRALSTSEDCADTTNFLAGVALTAPQAIDEATDAAIGCGRKTIVASLASQRFMATDFARGSRVYDRAALQWKRDEPGDPYAGPLLGPRYKEEAQTHLMARELGRLAKTFARYRPNSTQGERVDCAIAEIGALGGDAEARAKLEAQSHVACTVELAVVTDRSARAPLLKKLSKDEFRYEHGNLLTAWETDAELEPQARWEDAQLATQQYRFHAATLLVFPYSARIDPPAPIMETLARLDAMADIPPPLRLARARYRAMAARFEISIAEDAKARQRIDDALQDYRAISTLAPKWWMESFEAERVEAVELDAAMAIVTGDVERAEARLHALPRWIDESLPEMAFDKRAAQATAHVLAAYVALFRGDAGPLERFAASEECRRLSECIVVLPGTLASLKKVATGDAEHCQDVACLVAAHRPTSSRAALVARVDDEVGSMGVEHNLHDRLATLGRARRLALAIGDTRYDAAFARWLAVLRPLALDARLAVLFGEVNGRLFW